MSGRIAIITGGSRGLGRNMAEHLARRGVGIILTHRGVGDEAARVVAGIEAEGGKAVALALEVGRSADFPAFAAEIRRVLKDKWSRDGFDILVNNAGHGVHASIAETTEAQFDGLVDVHFKGVFFLTQALLPLLVDGGRILNVSSGLARFSLPGYAAYAAMKGAVEVLTRYLAKELGPRRISVNTLAPGAVETDFGGGRVRDDAALNAMVAAQTALGRVGLPDDIGGAVAALLDAEAGWITGQRIEASGGTLL